MSICQCRSVSPVRQATPGRTLNPTVFSSLFPLPASAFDPANRGTPGQWYPKDLIPQAFPRLLLFLSAAALAVAQPSALLDAMSQELNRNFTRLKEKADPPPYFLSYEITEMDGRSVSATWAPWRPTPTASAAPWTFPCAWGRPSSTTTTACAPPAEPSRASFTSGIAIPFEENANPIKRLLWLDTDRAYQLAAERLIRIQTNTQVRVAESDDSDDFSSEPPVVSVAAPRKLQFDARGLARPRAQAFGTLSKLPQRADLARVGLGPE